ncbi:MAG: DUF3536 domain-containing protein [Spirochaetales bacterium]|nr:DUF3536 domain-containing protein [Spirochaetales bacterium]
MKKTSIIIHGHFYQTPRENPYTGVVPIQSSAKPYDNWNESIFATCYKPNSTSRYLSADGRVDQIYNNYSRISVNFGQTLLDWIDDAHPVFIKMLRRADTESIRRYGHSSFMAQGFNHTIMPLDNEHIKRIQTEWAIESYIQRFGHSPEGFWLAECAINPETVDILSEYGIKFVVLAPWQANAIDGVPVANGAMPCDRPFIIEGKNGGRLSAFFYNGEFSSGVSFGHMLRDADAMFKSLKDLRLKMGNPDLISWATDGEIYGHHEPFGDMGLAALIRKIDESEEFEIENFASFLEKHPATEVATLSPGDEGLGTSWSCMHGVGRWMRDCGCHTGGDEKWNQSWRGPLRKAFNNLEESARRIIASNVRSILDCDYEKLTLDFKAVVSHRQTVAEFIDELGLKGNDRVTIATLLEAFRNIMFSYTSCGWFFNDISGIEPRQNISYAYHAASLLDAYTNENLTEKLLDDLSLAQSNIKDQGTGADIARSDLQPRKNHFSACSFFAMNRLVADPSQHVTDWGFMHLEKHEGNEMTVINTRTLQRNRVCYSSIPYAKGAMGFLLRDVESGESVRMNILTSSEKSMRSYICWVESRLSAGFPEAMIDTLAENIGNYLPLVATNRNLFKETVFTENIGTCIKAMKSLILDQPKMDMEKRIQRISQISYFVMIKGRPSDIQDITDAFSRRFYDYGLALTLDDTDTKGLSDALDLLEAARNAGFEPEITLLQDAAWTMRENGLAPELLKRVSNDLNFMPH